MLRSNGEKHIFLDGLLLLLFGGDILDRSLGRFKRWESDWTCDKPRQGRGKGMGEGMEKTLDV